MCKVYDISIDSENKYIVWCLVDMWFIMCGLYKAGAQVADVPLDIKEQKLPRFSINRIEWYVCVCMCEHEVEIKHHNLLFQETVFRIFPPPDTYTIMPSTPQDYNGL